MRRNTKARFLCELLNGDRIEALLFIFINEINKAICMSGERSDLFRRAILVNVWK